MRGGGTIAMKFPSRLISGLMFASLAFAMPASAQDAMTQIGNATITVGGGTATLDLPDVKFNKTIPIAAVGQTVSSRVTDADDFSDEIGWNINGAITAPMGGNKHVSLSGFWANIEDDDTSSCTSVAGAICIVNALIPNPAALVALAAAVGTSFISRTERDVDQAGVALEVKQLLTPGISGVTQAPNARYLALGADWRAIYQDMTINTTLPPGAFSQIYTEELDTDYYGVFAAYGGDYWPMLFKGLWNRWGLQSSFRLQGGIYYADTDYSGIMRSTSALALNSNAGDSNNEVAFIGGLTLETRKQIGRRATLSLRSEYEYYSYVPDMNYNDTINGGNLLGPNVGTTIGDDDAYAMRTSLRLTMKLGPDSIMEPQ